MRASTVRSELSVWSVSETMRIRKPQKVYLWITDLAEGMPTATVTSKGQITIPADVRKALGLRPGSRLVFAPTNSGVLEIHVQAASVQDLMGVVPQPSPLVTREDMDRAITAGATEPSP